LKITQLYISNNEISTLPQNIFTSFSNDVYIHANENLLTDFQPDLNKIKNLYLNDNKLTTIPQNIWNAR
jgi:Leucine-rich repeat (LRR) protein